MRQDCAEGACGGAGKRCYGKCSEDNVVVNRSYEEKWKNANVMIISIRLFNFFNKAFELWVRYIINGFGEL